MEANSGLVPRMVVQIKKPPPGLVDLTNRLVEIPLSFEENGEWLSGHQQSVYSHLEACTQPSAGTTKKEPHTIIARMTSGDTIILSADAVEAVFDQKMINKFYKESECFQAWRNAMDEHMNVNAGEGDSIYISSECFSNLFMQMEQEMLQMAQNGYSVSEVDALSILEEKLPSRAERLQYAHHRYCDVQNALPCDDDEGEHVGQTSLATLADLVLKEEITNQQIKRKLAEKNGRR